MKAQMRCQRDEMLMKVVIVRVRPCCPRALLEGTGSTTQKARNRAVYNRGKVFESWMWEGGGVRGDLGKGVKCMVWTNCCE